VEFGRKRGRKTEKWKKIKEKRGGKGWVGLNIERKGILLKYWDEERDVEERVQAARQKKEEKRRE